MLSASRHSLVGARLPTLHAAGASRSLISACFVVGPSRDLERPFRPFSSSNSSWNSPRGRPSKAKVEERRDKLERKRAVRLVKAAQQERKEEQARAVRYERSLEVRLKQQAAEDLAEGLPPVTEDELEDMYRGLLEATPQELALPALAPPATPLLLEDRDAEAGTRQERLAELERRLDGLTYLEEEVTPVEEDLSPGRSLGDELQARRGERSASSLDQIAPLVDGDEPSLVERIFRKLEEQNELVASEDAASAVSATTGVQIHTGLVVASEWRDVVLQCAEEGSTQDVERALTLMEKTMPMSDSTLLTEVMAVYASQHRARDALTLATFATAHSLPMSVDTHHHLLSAVLRAHPELAITHLHSLEAAGYTPLLATYTLVISSLLSPSSPAHLVPRGWDLYAHTRLVSHPVPSPELYSTMIAACARGAHPSPERAIDLFTEMTEDNHLPPTAEAYNGLIRASARKGTQEYYFEALRFMRQMLDNNVVPSRRTFHALLEGAKLHGDLSRARWMLVKMVGAGGEVAPDASTLGLVLQTYAAFKPAVAQAGSGGKKKRSSKGTVAQAATEPSVPTGPSTPALATDEFASDESDGIITLLGASSVHYPGPLPHTTDELLAEARNLMRQCVDPALVASADDATTATDTSEQPRSTVFPSVVPNTFLLNSYLALLAAHAPFDVVVDFWDQAYTRVGAERNRFGFETVMRRCEVAKNRTAATDTARRVFKEWQAWEKEHADKLAPAPAPAPSGDGEGSEGVSESERVMASTKDKRGENISRMWSSMIRILARSFHDTEALALLQTFISVFPPQNLVNQAHHHLDAVRRLPAQPTPARLSSPLYPETTGTRSIDRAPHILFDQVRVLHQRLAEVEDKKGVATVKAICNAYAGALKIAVEAEESGRRRRVGAGKGKKGEVVESSDGDEGEQ